ncbi:MAG: hypothetical protein H6811_01235 [Phycisphaeraceae bacterium]|nr:hypothetical protein [Phycisphaeraceae bacterium]
MNLARSVIAIAACGGLAACLPACQAPRARASEDGLVQPAAPDTRSVNSRCTFTGKPVDPRLNVTYKGTTIGFCSQGTFERFMAMDEAQRDAVAAKARAD